MIKIIRNRLYYIFLVSFSFFINFYTANIGVSPIDTFLHYDSGSRILKGIIPIRDYWIVHGLTIDYIQAFIFSIFGVNWTSYILHSSIVNVLLTLITFNFFLLIGLNKFHAFLLSVSFSILAYPISGTPFVDLHAVFFCLTGFYFFHFGVKKNYNYFFFIPILFGLAFFSKPVPSAYLFIIFILLFSWYLLKNKENIKLLKYLIYGALMFSLFLLFFLIFQKIDLKLFLIQQFYYPVSIGQDRLLTFDLNIIKIITNYKFILLPIILTFLFAINKSIIRKHRFEFLAFVSLVLFSVTCIYHQLLTKNQNFIFFLIPINLGFFILFLNKKYPNKSFVNYSIIGVLVFCVSISYKYHIRFNVNKKFHDLQSVVLKNNLPASQIHISLKPLKWITLNYPNPKQEIKNIKKTLNIINNDDKNLMVMTNYNFLSSISNKKIYTISRTYDLISFPDQHNTFFEDYKKFLINQIDTKKISNIYLFFSGNIPDELVKRYFGIYLNNNCIKYLKFNESLVKIDLENCVNFNE